MEGKPAFTSIKQVKSNFINVPFNNEVNILSGMKNMETKGLDDITAFFFSSFSLIIENEINLIISNSSMNDILKEKKLRQLAVLYFSFFKAYFSIPAIIISYFSSPDIDIDACYMLNMVEKLNSQKTFHLFHQLTNDITAQSSKKNENNLYNFCVEQLQTELKSIIEDIVATWHQASLASERKILYFNALFRQSEYEAYRDLSKQISDFENSPSESFFHHLLIDMNKFITNNEIDINFFSSKKLFKAKVEKINANHNFDLARNLIEIILDKADFIKENSSSQL